MEKILAVITLSRILGVFLILASIWLLKIIIKKEKGTIASAILFFLFLLVSFLYVSGSKYSEFTLLDLHAQLFPQKSLLLNYHVRKTGTPPHELTVYRFQEPRPPLKVVLDSRGKYSHIKDPGSLNRILKQLGLPEVKTGVPELSSITGSYIHASQYRWPDYPLGVLIVVKDRSQDRDAVIFYDSVIKISISSGR
jgi:hypothetical protein